MTPHPPGSGRSRFAGRTTLVALGALLACLSPALFSGGSASGPWAAAPAAADTGPVQAPALQAFGGCLNASRQADVVLLIDESGSLGSTDPRLPDGSTARVKAADYLLDRFASLAAATGSDIGVTLAGFAVNYDPVAGWTRLNQDALDGLHRQVAVFTSRTHGIDTDYWTALSGARDALETRARTRPASCQAVVLFTDGAFDIQPRTRRTARTDGVTKPYAPGVDLEFQADTTAERLGRHALCDAGGLADLLRDRPQRWTFAVGLQPPVPAGKKPQDFTLLRGIAIGSKVADQPCGTTRTGTSGDFYLASGLPQLLQTFESLSGSPPSRDTALCPQVGEGCVRRFVLDESISNVHVLATSDTKTLQLVLVAPGGGQLRVQRPEQPGASLRLGALAVEQSWLADGAVSLDFHRTSGAPWSGQWGLYFLDPRARQSGRPAGVAHSTIRITGDLVPSWLNPKSVPLVAGDVARGLALGVARADGSAVDPRHILGTAVLTVSFTPPGAASPTMEEQVDAKSHPTLDLDLGNAAAGTGRLNLSLAVTTAAVPPSGSTPAIPGTALEPQVVTLPLTISLPARYPTLPDRVDFGNVGQATRATAAMSVTGPGCVWIEGTTVAAVPPGGRRVDLRHDLPSSRATCLPLSEGQVTARRLTLSVQQPGDGPASGRIRVGLAPDRSEGRAITKDIRFAGEFQAPVDRRVFWVFFTIALLLGLGLPLAAAQVARWWGAKIPGVPLTAHLVPVTVRDGQVLRDGAPFALNLFEGKTVGVPSKGVRVLELPEGVVLRTRTGRNLRERGYAVVDSGGTSVAGTAVTSDRKGVRARLPLVVHNHWAALVGDGAQPALRILALPSSQATDEVRKKIADDVHARLPDLLQQLAGRGVPVPQASGDTWSGHPSAAGSAADDFFGPAASSPDRPSGGVPDTPTASGEHGWEWDGSGR